MSNLTHSLTRTVVGLAGALILATSCLLAATTPATAFNTVSVATISA